MSLRPHDVAAFLIAASCVAIILLGLVAIGLLTYCVWIAPS